MEVCDQNRSNFDLSGQNLDVSGDILHNDTINIEVDVSGGTLYNGTIYIEVTELESNGQNFDLSGNENP